MEDEQLYIFIDKTGHCFKDFQVSSKTKPDEFDKILPKPNNDGEQRYRNMVGAMLQDGEHFSVGDMFAFRDDLTDAGFEWGKDFYMKKVV